MAIPVGAALMTATIALAQMPDGIPPKTPMEEEELLTKEELIIIALGGAAELMTSGRVAL
jgi:hypothetical protein